MPAANQAPPLRLCYLYNIYALSTHNLDTIRTISKHYLHCIYTIITQYLLTIYCCHRETVQCYHHSDCEDDLSCVVGYCGDPAYLAALASMPCTEAGGIQHKHFQSLIIPFMYFPIHNSEYLLRSIYLKCRTTCVRTWAWAPSAAWMWRLGCGSWRPGSPRPRGASGAATTSAPPSPGRTTTSHGTSSVR